MKIYLAGQISGLSYIAVSSSFRSREIALSVGNNIVYNPLRCKSYLCNEQELDPVGYNSPNTTPSAILHTDYFHVENCDIFYLDLANSDRLSIGSICELAWAWQLRKHCVVVLPDNELYNHAFIIQMSHILFKHTIEAIAYILEFTDVQ